MMKSLSNVDPERLQTPSESEFLGKYAHCGSPVIITGVAEGWTANKLWTDQYLSTKLGHRLFLINRCKNGRFGIFSSRMEDAEGCRIASFSEVVSLMRISDDGDLHYMQQKSVVKALPELLPDIDYPAFVDMGCLKEVNFWLSQSSSAIPLHYDTFDNLLVQVRGSKRIILYSPEESANLYPGLEGAEFASQVLVSEPDLTRFPRFAHAVPRYHFSLMAGEILYIPAFWWHHITTESDCSLSLNYWYHLVHGHPREEYIMSSRGWTDALYRLRNLPLPQKRLAVQRVLLGIAELKTQMSNTAITSIEEECNEVSHGS